MKLFKYYLLVVAVSLLPLINIFLTPDLPHTHDGAVHLPRMAAYYKALFDGQILPRWAGDLNFGYGLPLFNFIYPTPYLLASLFIYFGLSLVLTFKMLITLSFVLSAIFMFAFAHNFLKDRNVALLVTLFYQFAPFRLVEMLVRGSLGEIYTYAFLPLVLYGLTKLMAKPNIANLAPAALATMLLIISHNSISLVFFGVSVLFLVFFSKTKTGLVAGSVALLLGLVASSFYWLPAVGEHQFTYGDLFMKDMFRSHFPPLIELVTPNLTNLPKLQTGGVSVQIGLFHLLAILVTLVLIIRQAKIASARRKLMVFSITLTAIALFFMLKLSQSIWERVSVLRQFQFPWRFLSLTTFSSSLVAVSFLELPLFRKKLPYLLLIAMMTLSTAYYWKPPLGFDKVHDEKAYWDYPLNTTYFGESDVIWSAGPAKNYPQERVEVIDGKARITNFYKRSNLHTYAVIAETAARLVDHTQYFPGWRVFIDNQKVPIEFQDQNWRGLITFAIPQGEHQVKVVFEKSKVQILSEVISWTTIGGLILLLFFSRTAKFRI